MSNDISINQLSSQSYQKIIFTLTNDLRRMGEYANKLKLDSIVHQIEELRQRVASHKFSIAVVGEFKRGKSTFINALLGKEILPADPLPTSATLNRITFGLTPKVQVFFKEKLGEPERYEEISIELLKDYVTKLTPEAKAISSLIREAVVYYPVPYCRIFNMDIIDTPGLNDENSLTEITLDILPRIDAAIMVIMADVPFSKSESEFLIKLLDQGFERVIFAVTALDRIRRVEDRQRVMVAIKNRIKDIFIKYAENRYGKEPQQFEYFLERIGEPRVWGLSGYLALEGKLTNSTEMLQESRFVEFEKDLEKLLTQESDFLAFTARSTQIIMAAQDILEAIKVRREILKEKRNLLQKSLHTAIAMIEALQQMGNQVILRSMNFKENLKNQRGLRPSEGFKGFFSKAYRVVMDTPAEINRLILEELERLHLFSTAFDRIIRYIDSLASKMRASNNISTIEDKETESLLLKLGGSVGYSREGALVILPASFTSEEIRVEIERNRIAPFLDSVFECFKKPIDESLRTVQVKLVSLRALVERVDVLAEQ